MWELAFYKGRTINPKPGASIPVIGPHTRSPSLSLVSLQKSLPCLLWMEAAADCHLPRLLCPSHLGLSDLPCSDQNMGLSSVSLVRTTFGAFSEAKSSFLFKINSQLLLLFGFLFLVLILLMFTCSYDACAHCCMCCHNSLPRRVSTPFVTPGSRRLETCTWCPLNSAPGAFCPCWFCFVPVTVINHSYELNSVQSHVRSSHESRNWRWTWGPPVYFSSFSFLMPLFVVFGAVSCFLYLWILMRVILQFCLGLQWLHRSTWGELTS